MSGPIRLTVYGTAKPQGSKTAFVNNGVARMREGSSKAAHAAFKDWREAVAAAARAWQADHNQALLDESVEVSIVFHLPRPKSAAKWKLWAATSPDLDKCVRLVNDSLTGTILVNDSRVVRLFAEKLYTLDAPRAEIVVTPLGDAERAGTARPLAAAPARAVAVAGGGLSIEADAEFIAAAHTDVPALVAEVDRLRKELSEARQEAREDYARAEQAESALVAMRARRGAVDDL